MKTAVVIPVFNREDLIRRSIESVLGQTREPDYVLIIDDGSNDSTLEVIHQYESSCVLIFRHQINLGVSVSRNRGILQALNLGVDWVFFLDSDDEWKPEKLRNQLAYVDTAPQYKVVFSREQWFRRGSHVKSPEYPADKFFEYSVRQCIFAASTAMIHRDIFNECGLFDESLPVCEDYDLWLRIMARAHVGFIRDMLSIRYQGHEGQLSQVTPFMDHYRIKVLHKLLGGGEFNRSDRQIMCRELKRKTDIVVNGCKKRNKKIPESIVESIRFLEDLNFDGRKRDPIHPY